MSARKKSVKKTARRPGRRRLLLLLGVFVVVALFGFWQSRAFFLGQVAPSCGDGILRGSSFLTPTSTRRTASAIEAYLASIRSILDIDGNGTLEADRDGLLLLRYTFHFSGNSLVTGALGANATRKTGSGVIAYILPNAARYDVNGDGAVAPFTDALLIMNYMNGKHGADLVGEECDDRNVTPGDGCSAACEIEAGFTCPTAGQPCVDTCGNGLKRGAEQCDDHNTTPGDGCSATCTVETGFTCPTAGQPCARAASSSSASSASSASVSPLCGNGVWDFAPYIETCDDGRHCLNATTNVRTACTQNAECAAVPGDHLCLTRSGDGCSDVCRKEQGFACPRQGKCSPLCGDGKKLGTEQCDDHNTVSGDGCSANCTTVESGYECLTPSQPCTLLCGNGSRNSGESCDDHNVTSGDGCSATCTIEPGFTCATPGQPCTEARVCGDGYKATTEACDDRNTTSNDGCSSTCTIENGYVCPTPGQKCVPACGDGQKTGNEQCDDHNTASGDGCSSTCMPEPGFTCTTPGQACVSLCGNGQADGPERCDDKNTVNGDGCSATCQVEAGYSCSGWNPSVCRGICGDGQVRGAEECDDGNRVDNDGCTNGCVKMQGYTCPAPGQVCTENKVCGDGYKASNEQCDDGNPQSGDGCNAVCMIEYFPKAFFSDDGAKAYVYYSNQMTKTLSIRDGKTGNPLMVVDLSAMTVSQLLMSRDGSKLFVFNGSREAPVVSIVDIPSGKVRKQITLGFLLKEMRMSQDETKVLLIGEMVGRQVQVSAIDTATDSLIGQAHALGNVTFSPDGLTVYAAWDENQSVHVQAIDVASGKLVKSVEVLGHSDKEYSLDNLYLSTDGKTLVLPIQAAYWASIDEWRHDDRKVAFFSLPSLALHTIDFPNDVDDDGILFAADGSKAYVSYWAFRRTFTVDLRSFTIAATVTPDAFHGSTFDADVSKAQRIGNLLYLPGSESAGSVVSQGLIVFDPADGHVQHRFVLGNWRMTLSPDGLRGLAFDGTEGVRDRPRPYLMMELTNGECGDGVKDTSEACDDGNAVAGDGCSPTCVVEQYYACTGSPSVCTLQGCAEGKWQSADARQCSDGNRTNGDGCDDHCSTERSCAATVATRLPQTYQGACWIAVPFPSGCEAECKKAGFAGADAKKVSQILASVRSCRAVYYLTFTSANGYTPADPYNLTWEGVDHLPSVGYIEPRMCTSYRDGGITKLRTYNRASNAFENKGGTAQNLCPCIPK